MLHLFSLRSWVIAHQVLLFVFRKGEVRPEALLMFSRVTNLLQTEGETSNSLACMVTLVVVMLLIHARRIRCLFLVFLCSCGHLSQWKGLTCKSMCFTHAGWLIPPLVSSIGWALVRICVFLLSSQYKTWGSLTKILFSWTVACLTLLPSSNWSFRVMCE